MRLDRLAVTDFGRIQRAVLQFARGLNVLYGPNDLGKSTLVNAIRAALLLQTNAKEGERFHRWGSASRPRVELDLEIEKDVPWHYHIEKSFGGSASLSGSAVGADPRTLARNRDVDAHLRENVLKWGIRPPGRGAQRGMPQSFLATVLLADQDDVDAILRDADLAEDGHENAQEWLTNVLEASAVDPFFRSVLEEVEQHYGEAFTETGRDRIAEGAPKRVMREKVNAVRAELQELEQQVAAAEDIHRVVAQRREELADLRDRLADATQAHDAVQAVFQQQEERQRLISELADKRTESEAAYQRRGRVRLLGFEVDAIQSKQNALESWLEFGENWVESRREAVVRAEKALGEATSDPESQKEALERTRLEADLERKQTALDGHADAVKAAEHIGELLEKQTARQQKVAALESSITAAEEELEGLDNDKHARQVRRLAHRRMACRIRSIELQLQQGTADRERLAEVQDEVAGLEKQAAEIEARLTARNLPDNDALEALRSLYGEFATAKAALNVGVELQLEPEEPLEVSLTRDDEPDEDQTWSEPVSITAARHIAVQIPGVGTVRVTTGTDEQRQHARTLQARWREQGEPVLQKAGVSSLDGLITAVKEARGEAEQARDVRDRIELLRRDAPDPDALDAGRAELTKELDSLQASLNEDDDRAASVEACQERTLATLEEVREAQTLLDAQLTQVEAVSAERDQRRKTLNEQLIEQRAERKAAAEALQDVTDQLARYSEEAVESWEETLSRAETRQAELANGIQELQTALDALESDEQGAAPEQQQAVSEAQEQLELAKEKLAELRALRDQLAEEATETRVSWQHEKEQAEAEDLDAIDADVKALEEQVAALRSSDDGVDDELEEETLDEARRTMESLQEQVRTAELNLREAQGQLSRASGQTAEEERQALQQRMDRLEQREREMEQEYAGWRLLREVMHRVQEEQTANLGNAVAPVITERFRQLSDRGYQLSVGSTLSADGIVAAGEAREPELFSVGTREQMATVYRLTLAERLESVLVLDDQLVQSDRQRMAGLRRLLREAAQTIQILVFTCRPEDYLSIDELESAETGVATDGVNVVDLEQVVTAG